ncbi:MAG TPA: glycosyltransferase, partial [Armatimonadetes bacterium]|nr:glycosyltransferase [Armatimonadota bacterium]
GLATFTQDLVHSIETHAYVSQPIVVAVSDCERAYHYDHHVQFVIRKNHLSDYIHAAKFLNDSPVDIVNVQHEFGIFGGNDGEYVLKFYEHLNKPVVTTFHTVLYRPDEQKRRITRIIAQHSDRLIVMNSLAFWLLSEHYGVDPDNAVLIYHGAPDTPFGQKGKAKRQFGLDGRTVLSTFGLINRGKGIEYAITALKQVVPYHSDVVYLVIGRTHPGVVRQEGESYRAELQALVADYGLHDHVRFVNKYLSKDELLSYLQATDIYLCPYIELNQIVSGTLAYAIASGKVVISTPSLYAQEILSEGRGLLCDVRNPNSIADKINYLLDNPRERELMERRAYRFGRQMTWQVVAWDHEKLYRQVIARSHAKGHYSWQPVQPTESAYTWAHV